MINTEEMNIGRHAAVTLSQCSVVAMEYRATLPKGRGYVYACNDQLYRQVKKSGQIRYLKCRVEFCDGSAKIDNGAFSLGVTHAVGAHTDALQPSQHADSSDDDEDEQLTPTAASASASVSVSGGPAAADTPLRCCEVCLLAPIEGFALVPCGLQS